MWVSDPTELKKAITTYLQGIENDIQLNCVLTSYHVIDFACVCERVENQKGDYQQQSP